MLIGNEVNAAVLMQDPQYAHSEIDTLLLSKVAIQRQSLSNSNGVTLQEEAYQALNAMKEEYGNGASTLVMIFNASGETLAFKKKWNYAGDTDKYAMDSLIRNGQYSIFLHVSQHFFGSSEAAVVYVGESGESFLMAWDNPYRGLNSVHAMVGEEPNFWMNVRWEYVWQELQASGSYEAYEHATYAIYSNIGPETSPIASYMITRNHLPQ